MITWIAVIVVLLVLSYFYMVEDPMSALFGIVTGIVIIAFIGGWIFLIVSFVKWLWRPVT